MQETTSRPPGRRGGGVMNWLGYFGFMCGTALVAITTRPVAESVLVSLVGVIVIAVSCDSIGRSEERRKAAAKPAGGG